MFLVVFGNLIVVGCSFWCWLNWREMDGYFEYSVDLEGDFEDVMSLVLRLFGIKVSFGF